MVRIEMILMEVSCQGVHCSKECGADLALPGRRGHVARDPAIVSPEPGHWPRRRISALVTSSSLCGSSWPSAGREGGGGG